MLPILPVIEVAARQARAQAAKRFNVPAENVNVWDIASYCPAMVTYTKNSESKINYVVSVGKIYGEVSRVVSAAQPTEKDLKPPLMV